MKRTLSAAERLARLDRSIYLVGKHRAAGHDLSNPKFVIDLTSLLLNARRLHDIVGPIPQEREILSYLARNTATHEELENAMARLDPITTGITDIGTAVDGVAAEVAKVAAQLAAQTADQITDAQIADAATALTGIATKLGEVKASTDSLVEVAGEDDPSTEPTV